MLIEDQYELARAKKTIREAQHYVHWVNSTGPFAPRPWWDFGPRSPWAMAMILVGPPPLPPGALEDAVATVKRLEGPDFPVNA